MALLQLSTMYGNFLFFFLLFIIKIACLEISCVLVVTIGVVVEEEAQDSSNPEVTRLKEEKNLINMTIAGLEMEKMRIEKQQTMLQSYADSITDSHKSNAAVQLSQLLQKETVDDMMSFVDRFGEESFSIMEKLHSIDKEIKQLQEQIKTVSSETFICILIIHSLFFVPPKTKSTPLFRTRSLLF